MSNDDEGIYRVDTIPPPQGEGDAYSAPTKVGVLASAIVEELVAASQREAEAKAQPADLTDKDEDNVGATRVVESEKMVAALASKPSQPPPAAPAVAKAEPAKAEVEKVEIPSSPPVFPLGAPEPEPEPAKAAAVAAPATTPAAAAGPNKMAIIALAVVAVAIAIYFLAR